MITQIASRAWWHRHLSRSARSWQELETFPRLSPGGQRRALAERLLARIQYFGQREDALPEWREAARIRNPQDLWRIWQDLPIMDKKMLQSRFQPQEIQRRFGLEGIVKSTGGSTGEPTHIFHDTAMTLAANAASTYTRMRMGWRPGMATIIIWGSERDIGRKTSLRSRCYVRMMRDFVVDGYELNEQTVDRVVELIGKHRPVAVQGFTSMLAFVARTLLERKRKVPAGSVHTAWNGGEMLFSDQSEIFRQAFGKPILNRYGGRELSVMACQFTERGPLEVLRPWVFLEVVNEAGKPVGAGESGRLIWTSTVSGGTPLLRYDIGDLGSFHSSDTGEAGICRLARIEGRFAGLLRLPNGKKINCIYWNHLFKEFPEVRQFQVALRGDTGLELRLQGSGLANDREALLRRTLADFIGSSPIAIHWMERLPLTRQGKLVQVVREPAETGGSYACAAERC